MAGKYLSLLVHFTWSTAGREPWLEANMRDDLYSYIGGIMRQKKAKLLSAGGMFDHIHLYASMPSTISIADFVNAVRLDHALTDVAIKFRPFGPGLCFNPTDIFGEK
jgi:REP-associated tyrosine transposase